MIEKDIIGGAAHLWDCIPSKAMIATGGTLARMGKASGMGLQKISADLDLEVLSSAHPVDRGPPRALHHRAAHEPGREPDPGHGPPRRAPPGRGRQRRRARSRSRPTSCCWPPAAGPASPTGPRSTASACSPPATPTRRRRCPSTSWSSAPASPVWSSSTCSARSAARSPSSSAASRCSRTKDPEVAAALEDDFIARGVRLFKGARAIGIEKEDGAVTVVCDDGRRARGTHALLAIGSIPNSESLGLDAAGVEQRDGYVVVDHNCESSVPDIYAAGDLSGQAAAVVGGLDAGPQDRRARHGPPRRRAAPPPRLRQGRLGHLHRARDRRRGPGRGRRLRRGPQDPGDQGAVLGQRQGPHRERRPGLREDHLRPRHRRDPRRLDRRVAVPPSSSR